MRAGLNRLPLAARAELEAELAARAPDFGWFGPDLSGLAIEALPDDLDAMIRTAVTEGPQ